MNLKKALIPLLITMIVSCSPDKFDYQISEYTLCIEPMDNGKDARVTIDLCYQIEDSCAKNDGFKYVGNGIVDSLVCSDETGIIKGNIEYLRETKISWYFEPVKSGTKKIKAKFILRNFIMNEENHESEIYAPWAGVFRVPVEKAKYIIVMHQANAKLKFETPKHWKHEYVDGSDNYSITQCPLKQELINIELIK